MRKVIGTLLVIAGIIAITASTIYFMGFMFQMEGEENAKAQTLCVGDETLRHEVHGSGDSRSEVFYCVAPNGNLREITLQVMAQFYGGSIIIFVVGLVGGILATILGSLLLRSRTRRQLLANTADMFLS
jgi:hypothetical protein